MKTVELFILLEYKNLKPEGIAKVLKTKTTKQIEDKYYGTKKSLKK